MHALTSSSNVPTHADGMRGDSDASVLELKGVTKGFASTIAVRDLSIAFRAGEVHALVGENGAGKSTLLKLLVGEHRPDAGEVLLDGRPRALANPHVAHRAGVRLVSQEPDIVPAVTVAENIFLGELPTRRGRVDRRYLRRQAEDLLREHGFLEVLPPERMGSELTPAQRQMVEIMRAMRAGLRLVAFDEPTSSLSDEETQLLFALVRRLRAQGVSVVYVSHRLHEIFELADRIHILRDGVLRGERSVGETNEDELVRLMVGREVETILQRRRSAREDVVLDLRSICSEWHQDVSFQVRAGEVVGLAGLVGAGRSELARIVFGDLQATSGEVLIAGAPVRGREPADVMRAGVALAPEERKAEALLGGRSVRENISIANLGALRRGPFVNRGAERRLASSYIDELNVVTPSAETEIGKLSGGNQQKAVLARWLARKPQLLILDEPTRGIDVGVKADIYRLVDDLAADGVAVLLISSEMLEILGLSDRVLVMREGEIAGELHGDEADEESVLRLAIPEVAPAGADGGESDS